MHSLSPLSRTFSDSRRAFLDAATAAGALIESHPHPLRGPAGEDLAIDVAELGPDDAADVVLVVSATHGVEGFCGSALQRNWLQHRVDDRPEHVRLVFIHGLNPYGFAWVRRVNEDNIDLNRNFLDWSEPTPVNRGYDEIAHLVVPREWTEAEQTRTTLELLDIMSRDGESHLQSVISRGQYSHPEGVFYGGTEPAWSNTWLRGWYTTRLASAQRLAIIDIHSGLGESGDAELICIPRVGTPGYERAADLWGDVTSMFDGQSASSVLDGDWLSCAEELLPGTETTAIALEYGTVDSISVAQALRADAWLHAHGDPNGPDAPAIQAQVRAAFLVDDPIWLATLWERFVDVLGRALAR